MYYTIDNELQDAKVALADLLLMKTAGEIDNRTFKDASGNILEKVAYIADLIDNPNNPKATYKPVPVSEPVHVPEPVQKPRKKPNKFLKHLRKYKYPYLGVGAGLGGLGYYLYKKNK